MVSEWYNSFVNRASSINGFIVGQKENVPYDITELANNYVQALNEGDEYKKNQYISALMIRYWHMISKLYESSKTLNIELEDVIGWIYDSIEKACAYHSWLDEEKEISQDPKGAEKCINQCITSTRQWWFKNLNQDKRKLNNEVNLLSLNDYKKSSTADKPVTLMDSIGECDNYSILDSIITNATNNGRVFDALVIDSIINQDVFVASEKSKTHIIYDNKEEDGIEEDYVSTTYNFSKIRLISHFKNLSTEFVDYFVSKYDVDRDLIEQEVAKIMNYKPFKIRNKVNEALDRFKKSKEILSLCM